MQRGGNAPTRTQRRAPLHGHGHALAHNQPRDEDRTEHGTLGTNESSKRGKVYCLRRTLGRDCRKDRDSLSADGAVVC